MRACTDILPHPSSGVNLAYFPPGLQLPCSTFLTTLLLSLIVVGLVCVDKGPWGQEGHPNDGNTSATPSFYVCMWEIARLKLNKIKILNAEIFIQ